jgi:hypothetical protein
MVMFDDPDTSRAFFGEPPGCCAAGVAAGRPATHGALIAGTPILLRIAAALRFAANRMQAWRTRRYGDV